MKSVSEAENIFRVRIYFKVIKVGMCVLCVVGTACPEMPIEYVVVAGVGWHACVTFSCHCGFWLLWVLLQSAAGLALPLQELGPNGDVLWSSRARELAAAVCTVQQRISLGSVSALHNSSLGAAQHCLWMLCGSASLPAVQRVKHTAVLLYTN